MTAYVPSTDEQDLRKYALSLQQLAAGRSNAGGTITCSTGETTTVSDNNVSAGSRIQLTASSSDGAAAIASVWFDYAINGQFTIRHTVDSSTGRSFVYSIQG